MAGTKSGDVLIPLAEGAITESHFGDELGQVITKVRPGRTDEKEITLYNSVGIGTQDIATARVVLAAARDAGLGTEIVLTS
jgi:ornithine cyclodeaminase/alanine dehydrogenase